MLERDSRDCTFKKIRFFLSLSLSFSLCFAIQKVDFYLGFNTLKMKLFLKTCFVVFFLANWNISEFVYCQNQTLNENVVATFYRTFYTIVKLSNSFHQFPMRDDFKKSIPSPEVRNFATGTQR